MQLRTARGFPVRRANFVVHIHIITVSLGLSSPRAWARGFLGGGCRKEETGRVRLTLVLTHQCDLACTYCYAGRKFDQSMDPALGRRAILKRSGQRPSRKLVAIETRGKGIARKGYPIWAEGAKVGAVTSGTFSPTLQEAVGFARVPPATGDMCQVQVRKKRMDARVVKLPFVRQGKILV